jgi:hypothetical protein
MANIFTNAGVALLTDLLDKTSTVPSWFIGWGTGAGTAVAGDTTLSTEASEARVAASMSQPSASVNQFQGTIITSGSGKTITNAGVLSASSAGTLFIKSDFAGIVLDIGESIQFTFQLTHSNPP